MTLKLTKKTDSINATLLVPSWQHAAVVEKLIKLNKRAKKNDLPQLALDTDAGRVTWPHPEKEAREAGAVVELVGVTVVGSAPVVEGFELLATIDHDDGINVLRGVPGVGDLPKSFRDADPRHCDHCGFDRRRRQTFVIRDTESGEIKRVGRQCIRDFIGYAIPRAAMNLVRDLAELVDGIEGVESFGGRSECGFDTRAFLAAASAYCRANGFRSRKAADSYNEQAEPGREVSPTSDDVWHQLVHATVPTCCGRYRSDFVPLPLTDADFETADAAVAWLDTQDDSDFIFNCKQTAKVPVTNRRKGIATAIVGCYLRDTQKAEERAAAPQSEHVGTVGKRETFEIVDAVILASWPGFAYGSTTYLRKLTDADGNSLVWKTTNGSDFDDEHADRWTIKATVKAHDAYRGQKQTIVTRVKVESTRSSAEPDRLFEGDRVVDAEGRDCVIGFVNSTDRADDPTEDYLNVLLADGSGYSDTRRAGDLKRAQPKPKKKRSRKKAS